MQLRIVTQPQRKDIPKQMIKIEIANIPAYTKEPKRLLLNYPFLPDGYKDIIIMVETLEEIVADKVVAFVNQFDQIPRYRDIWDLHWLRQQGAKIDNELIRKKIIDYNIGLEKFVEKLDNITPKLQETIFGQDFQTIMSRFLPINEQEKTILNEKYLRLLLIETAKMFENLGKDIL